MGLPASAARRAEVNTTMREAQTSVSSASHSRKGGSGRRKVISAATISVLMMPPKKIGREPNRPPSRATWISAGTLRPGLTSHFVRRHAGKL